MDEFEDSEVRAALRERAARTRPPLDAGEAFESVRRRARRRRIRNGVATGIGGAAAVAAIAIGVGALTSDRDVVRTPATAPPETARRPVADVGATDHRRLDVDDVHPLDDDHHLADLRRRPRRRRDLPQRPGPTRASAARSRCELADGRIALVGDPAPRPGSPPTSTTTVPIVCGCGSSRRPRTSRSASTSSTAGWPADPGPTTTRGRAPRASRSDDTPAQGRLRPWLGSGRTTPGRGRARAGQLRARFGLGLTQPRRRPRRVEKDHPLPTEEGLVRPFDHLSRRHVVPLAAFIGSAALAGAGLTLATSDGGGGTRSRRCGRPRSPPPDAAARRRRAKPSRLQHLRFHPVERQRADLLVERARHRHPPHRARVEHVGHRHDADRRRIEHVGDRHDDSTTMMTTDDQDDNRDRGRRRPTDDDRDDDNSGPGNGDDGRPRRQLRPGADDDDDRRRQLGSRLGGGDDD